MPNKFTNHNQKSLPPKSYFFSSAPFDSIKMVFLTFAGLILLFVLRITTDLNPIILYPFLFFYLIPIVFSILKRRVSFFTIGPYLMVAFLFFTGQMHPPKQVSPRYVDTYWIQFNSKNEYIGQSKMYLMERDGMPDFRETYSGEIEIWYYANKTVKFVEGEVEAYSARNTSHIRTFEN